MKSIGDAVRLRRAFGPPIRAGDLLITKTNRRYHVLQVSGRTLHCVVVDRFFTSGPGARQLLWHWLTPMQRRLGANALVAG